MQPGSPVHPNAPKLIWHHAEWTFETTSPCCGEPVLIPLRTVVYRRRHGPPLLELQCGLTIHQQGLPELWVRAAPGCHLTRFYDLTAEYWVVPKVLPPEPDGLPPGLNIRRY
jgi:hypothetical protein